MRLILAAALALLAPPAAACGPDSDCSVSGNRTYRLYLPEGTDGPTGAIFHAHGYRGSAGAAMNNAALRAMADRLGMALIAINADADDWNLAHRPREPEQAEAREYDYVAAVIADVATRIDLDRDRLIATGFSAGGMMTWTLACGMGETFAGFVPHSGTFWAPVPETCPSPVQHLIHIHGNDDPVVPIEGRPIGQARQGNVMEALNLYAGHGAAGEAILVDMPHGLTCISAENQRGMMLEFCTFVGGHSYSTTRVEWAIERILGRL